MCTEGAVRPARRRGLAGAVLVVLVALARDTQSDITPGPPATSYDLVIKNGRIVDGTGNPWRRGDVAVTGDTIVRIASRIDGHARRIIDAAGHVVAPGFIDIHVHARDGIFATPTADNYVRQGVVTVMDGPDGASPLPIRSFLDRVARGHVTPNVGMFVGQGSVRQAVIGMADRAATPAELDQMRELVRRGMMDGAFGLSSGLFYVPGAFTPTGEIVELAKVAGSMGGIYISHIRNEASGVVDSVREAIEIGQTAGLPTQITHHKMIGKASWGNSVITLGLIDEARARGVDATMDQYPYTATSTMLSAALLPAWALEGGQPALAVRLRVAATRQRIHEATARVLREERGGGDPQNVQLARCDHDPALDGMRLGDVTRARGLDATIDNAAETAVRLVERGDCLAIFHAISEDDLQRILRHPATMIASDGEVPMFGQAHPHPRSYGTFARVLGRYVRERKIITLEDAVRKMSSFPARRLGLADRGLLREAMKADIVVFDPETVRDLATFERPHQYAEGVDVVIINGEIAFEHGKLTALRPGRVLLGPGTKR
jgi:dihydroorotase/N-acyl-D-amino-acid deacylase